MTDHGTPTWLRSQNDRNALRLLMENGPLSRSQLSKLSGLSKPTAGAMLQRLEKTGLVAPVGTVTDAHGPNATAYGVRADILVGVAVNVLADRLESVVVNVRDFAYPLAEVPTAILSRTPANDVETAVQAACAMAGVDVSTVGIVVIGVQAAVDADADHISFTNTLPGWPGSGAIKMIEDASGREILLHNDVNLATIAEQGVSSERDFAYLWMGYGLKVGIDIGGHVQIGASGSAGEIGYLEVLRSAVDLDPAAQDFTDLLGAQAIARLMGEKTLDRALALLPGNESALVAIARRVALLCQVLGTVINPACVVLGGPTGFAGGERLAELVQEGLSVGQIPVRSGRVTDHPVLRGAQSLLVSRLRVHFEARVEDNVG